MYTESPILMQPANENIKVWRYMDFTKFISLIEKKEIYFTRADKFEDPFEGSLPMRTFDIRNRFLACTSEEERKLRIKECKRKNKAQRRHVAINCWHENEFESTAMWKLYLESDKGIAIQSTYKLLKNSFIEGNKIFLGKVTYIDFTKESTKFYDHFEQFCIKRKSFEHEKEIRALITNLSFGNNDLDLSKPLPDGLGISVNLEKLIQNIYVAPNSPNWILKLVKNTVERCGYKFKVKKSHLDKRPLF